MSRDRAGAREGFTLLEVLVAVFIFATTMVGLMIAVRQNVSKIADAREELRTMRRAEERLREVESEVRLGFPPEFGTTRGQFEMPDDDLSWELVVEPLELSLPEELEGVRLAEDSIFSSEPPARGARGGDEDLRPRRVELRVYPTDGDPESVDPFSILVAPSATPLPEDLGQGAEAEAPQ